MNSFAPPSSLVYTHILSGDSLFLYPPFFMKLSQKKLMIIAASTFLALIFLTLPFTYTHIASTYLFSATIYSPSIQLMSWKDTPFDATAWKNATDLPGRSTRGSMTKNLLISTNFSKMTPEEIKALLGEPNGYLNYDHILSYVVQEGTDTYMLGFSNGKALLKKW